MFSTEYKKVQKIASAIFMFSLVLSFVSPLQVFAENGLTNDVKLCPREIIVVSDTSNEIEGGGNAVATYSENERWTAQIPGATWIWKSFFVQDSLRDEMGTFSKTFDIVLGSVIDSASLIVAADNSYTVSINGNQVGMNDTEFNYFDENKDTYDVASNLRYGSNTISFTVKNWALASSTAESNPAGLLYKLSINLQSPCEDEGNGGGTPPAYEHTCALPDSLGDATVEPIVPGGDSVSLQDVFNAKGINKNVITDQKQYQFWNTPSATTTINIEFLSRNAALNSVFGYYKNGDISNFSPIFRSGDVSGFASTTEFSEGQSAIVHITSAYNIGFAIKTSAGTTYASLNSLNENNDDHVAVYELGSNVYVIAFEDLPLASSDMDYNDIIVKMTVSGCQNAPQTPSLSLTAAPATINLGATSTLTWLSQNTLSCSAAWTSATSTSGSEIVSPATTTDYQIVCTGNGGSATSTATVTVLTGTTTPPVNTPPTITLIGDNPLNLTVGDTFTDPGATANDAEDGNLTSQIIVSGSVNASTTGTYTLTYSVHDSGGLGATTTREVAVSPVPTPPTPPPTNGGGGGGIGGRRHPVAVGEILGAVSCSYLRDYLKIDWQNDPVEVLKLQSFLNVFEGESLSYTGVFDETTFAAVQRFQIKYSGDILEPWGDKVTTGFVYILTKKKINEIYCNTIYPLTAGQQSEIDAFKASGSSVSGVVGMGDGGSGISGRGIAEGTGVPVVELEGDSAGTATGTMAGSVLKNAAVSLFALPQKLFGGRFGGYTSLLLVLILVAIAIAVARFFAGSDEEEEEFPSTPALFSEAPEGEEEKESPIILPGGEMVIEKEEEEPEVVIEPEEEKNTEGPTTPDLR